MKCDSCVEKQEKGEYGICDDCYERNQSHEADEPYYLANF